MLGSWKFWAVIGIIGLFILILVIKYKTCKKQANKLGVPCRCKLFSSDPVTLIAEDHYYGKRDGKCYEILDYGSNMSFKEVELSLCETEKEKQERQERQNITEVEYI